MDQIEKHYRATEESDKNRNRKTAKSGAILKIPTSVFENKITTDSIELLTIAEVADLLKISGMSVRRLQLGRQLPFVKVGGSVRFFKYDIVSYLQRMRVESIK